MEAIEAAVIAYNINAYICIDEFGSASSSNPDFVRRVDQQLIDHADPETLLIERENQWAQYWYFNELSEEARQVLTMILECPDEMKSIIGQGKGKGNISIKKLGRYLRKQWQERKITKDVLQEIAEYAVNLEAY